LVLLLVCGLAGGCTWARKLTSRSAGQARELADLAQQAQERGESEEALDLLNEAVQKNPDDAEIHRQIARILLGQGDDDTAVTHLRRAVACNPDDTQCHVQLAGVLFRAGRQEAAEAAVNAALETDPENIEALMLRADLAEHLGQDSVALGTYHQILSCDPGNIEAKLRAATIQVTAEKPKRAAPLLRSLCQCADATPQQLADAEWALGIAYGQEARWVDAADSLLAALPRRKQATADDWYRLAYSRYRAGDLQRARENLLTALSLSPEHQNALAMASVLNSRDSDAARAVVLAAMPASAIPPPPGWQAPASE
jgi:tetratricopeptide (TPR) repeat protein